MPLVYLQFLHRYLSYDEFYDTMMGTLKRWFYCTRALPLFNLGRLGSLLTKLCNEIFYDWSLNVQMFDTENVYKQVHILL